jgi:hypothetical protein
MAPNYHVQAPNATAVNILRSWLNSLKIPNRPGDGSGSDLTVVTADGKNVEVKVCLRGEAPPADKVVVFSNEMTGKKTDVAVAAFHRVTETAGYGKPVPLDRGAEPEKNANGNPRKLHYRDEPLLVAIRHTEFRRSPNPPDDRWKLYRPTIEKTSWAFMRLNYELCLRNGLGIDDLMSHARCWTVNFCARYETPTPVNHDNERKLYAYLQQRFANDLRMILKKKERSVLPDAETVAVALYGRPDHWTQDPQALMEEAEAAQEEPPGDPDRCELDLSSASARRDSAAKLLQKLLDELPHDRFVEVLTETAQNTAFDIITRKEASRRLRVHLDDCETCGTELEDEATPAQAPVVVAPPVTTMTSDRLPSSDLPQADLLATLRLLLEEVTREGGDELSDVELGAAVGITERQVQYYKHASRLLGFMVKGDVTPWGEELLASDTGSAEERSIFRTAIEGMAAYPGLAWFFSSTASKAALVEYMLAHYRISPGVANRRALSLLRWRKELRNARVEEDEDLSGADSGSTEE